jgi:Family of unknown function (DUF6328)
VTGEARRPDEHPKERVDRELIELLNELRVALPGVQVLFAFLLIVPFSQNYDVLTASDRRVYFAAVLGSAAASAFLIAPSAHHRLRFRAGSKERMLKVANALAIAGMVALAFSMSCVVYVISSVLHSSTVAAVITAAVALAIAGLWFVLPLTFPREGEDRPVP